MEQLIELLKQIQELAGVAIDALETAEGGGKEGGDRKPPEDRKPPSEKMEEGRPPGDGPPPEEPPE